MERNLEYIRSKLIDGEIVSSYDETMIALVRNDRTLLKFCHRTFKDDDEAIDLCNFISIAADLLSDRFEFSRYDDYYCYEVIFSDTMIENSYLGIYVQEFPRQVTLVYHSYHDESISLTKYFSFTNLEDAERIISNFMHQIYQSKEN